MKLLVTLGIPHRGIVREGSDRAYAHGAIAIIDWKSKKLVRYEEYAPPASRRHPDASVVLTFGSFHGDHFYTCAPTEVLRVSFPQLRLESILSHPTFNDLHHVAVTDDRLLVCNTGLEILQTFDHSGNLLETFNAASKPTSERFSPDVDYRKEFTTKPHESHINFIFFYEGKTWITRFHQQDAICVSDPADRISLPAGNPHDGIVSGNDIYFTTTNGHLLRVNGRERRVVKDIDLTAIKRSLEGVPIGWCRGLHVQDGFAYVGFSRIRKTKFVEFARWVRDFGAMRHPARIEKIDLETGDMVDTFVFESSTGAAVFSITRLPEHLA